MNPNFKYIQESNENNRQGFISDFTESKDNGNETFIITIEGIHVTTTGNNTRYNEEELKGSRKNLTGVHSWTKPYNNPVLTHHDQHNGEPIGRVLEAKFSNSTLAGKSGIVLKAEISDEDAKEKIKDGRYKTVSVGGNVGKAVCSICNTDWVNDGWCEHMPGREYDDEVMELIMKDITFVEVSFVNVPADEYAGLIAYDTVEDKDAETEFENSRYQPQTAFREDTFQENQGGSKDNMDGDNLKEKLDLKKERISLLKEQLSEQENKVEGLQEKNNELKDKKELLEGNINNLQEEVKDLNEKNKNLKDKQVRFVAEKILEKKVELNHIPESIPEDKEEEVLEKLKDKSIEFLQDLLEDLEYEETLNQEEYEGFEEEVDNETKHSSEEDNVDTDESEEDEFDINEEFKNL